jgi:cytochrome c biogenesis protein CcdA/thiol-disulfide isomerase/thioredoxin
MVLLILFAFLAGIGTALSPCVLPVLPIALSAGATGGKRRPLGIVTGLALSFTFVTVAFVYVIHWLGLPDDLLRKVAIVGLICFGVALAVPPIGDRLEAWLSRIVPQGASRRGGDGFGSGLVVGFGLGAVYTPCAGPILAGVITLSASQAFTAGRLATALAYGVGSAVALYFLMLGGRRLTRRLSKRSGRFQQSLGAVMVAVAVLMALNLDVRFQNAIASDLPSFLVNPTGDLEKSGSVKKQLADVRGGHAGSKPGAAETPSHANTSSLPKLGAAPEIQGTQQWFNTPGDRPLSLASLRRQNRVVLVDFWTYTCINCIRTLPQLKAWDAKYRSSGLTIIGVHTPEFPFEKDAGNVRSAIAQNGIRYPVAQDNDYATWNAYANQYWPAHYLIDANGQVRYVHFGEGKYQETERAIRALLQEAGEGRGLGGASRPAVVQPTHLATPETYLGSQRAERFDNGPIRDGVHDYGQSKATPRPDHLAYRGTWKIDPEGAAAGAGARLLLNFRARDVYLVLGSRDRPRAMRVLLDGKPISAANSGPDVHGGVVRVGQQRLYRLVSLPASGDHVLELQPAAGTRGYAFTFG